jgi:hypothetical protein
MMLRFLSWMILIFIVAKIVGKIIRSIRIALTPNNDIMNTKQQPQTRNGKIVEDIPYEEVKDKQ